MAVIEQGLFYIIGKFAYELKTLRGINGGGDFHFVDFFVSRILCLTVYYAMHYIIYKEVFMWIYN